MDAARHSRLRYLDAGDIEDSRVDFDGLDVHNPAGEKLGDVDGFIIDRDSHRPYYVVVDSGGWFSSRRYLVPIGHARLDTDNDSLRIDIGRETIERFPAFDADRFEEMPEEEATRLNEQVLTACCPAEVKGRQFEGRWDYDAWSHYQVPDWWQSRPIGSTTASAGTTDRFTTRPTTSTTVPPPPASADTYDPLVTPREEIVARRADHDVMDREIDIERRDREDLSDSVTERAQPGDVLGIERDGETTALGDTARDEDKRVRDAEEDIRDLRKDRDEP